MATESGYWKYLGSSEAPDSPRILTRAEKNQALTHLEMDFNLASLVHTVETNSVDDSNENDYGAVYATFSYAPILNEEGGVEVQNDPVTIQIKPSLNEILETIANETIPGSLTTRDDLIVSGSVFSENGVRGYRGQFDDLEVEKSASFKQNVRVEGSASFDGDVYIKGNVYINGVLFGNLSQSAYNSPDYAQAYQRWGTLDTASIQRELLGLHNRISQLEQLLGGGA